MQVIRHRNMGVRAAALVCLLGLAGAVLCSGQEQPQVNRGLKILYAGHPGSDREKDFVQFLGRYFTTVKTADLNAFVQKGFKEEDVKGFDVTILDYDGDGFKTPHLSIVPPILPGFARAMSRNPRAADQAFSRPLITVGVAGGLMCDRWGLKTGYM